MVNAAQRFTDYALQFYLFIYHTLCALNFACKKPKSKANPNFFRRIKFKTFRKNSDQMYILMENYFDLTRMHKMLNSISYIDTQFIFPM